MVAITLLPSQVCLLSVLRLTVIADGQLFGWGSNEFGQLGMGATFVESFTTPQLIAGGGLGQHKIVKIVCGYDNSFAWTGMMFP